MRLRSSTEPISLTSCKVTEQPMSRNVSASRHDVAEFPVAFVKLDNNKIVCPMLNAWGSDSRQVSHCCVGSDVPGDPDPAMVRCRVILKNPAKGFQLPGIKVINGSRGAHSQLKPVSSITRIASVYPGSSSSCHVCHCFEVVFASLSERNRLAAPRI